MSSQPKCVSMLKTNRTKAAAAGRYGGMNRARESRNRKWPTPAIIKNERRSQARGVLYPCVH